MSYLWYNIWSYRILTIQIVYTFSDFSYMYYKISNDEPQTLSIRLWTKIYHAIISTVNIYIRE